MSAVYHTVHQLSLFPSKVCPACQTDKLLDEFHIQRDKKDGHASWCKQCSKVQSAERYRANREQFEARIRRYKANNPEKVKQMRHDHHIAHLERDRQTSKAWQKANREKVLKFSEKWRETHPEYRREWQKANRDKGIASTHRYLARKRDATIGEVDFVRVFERCDGTCYICNKSIEPYHKTEFDHVIPLARGGPHCEDNLKVVHLCCNRRKHDNLFEEMTPHQRRGPDC